MKTQSDFSQHICHLELDKLHLGKRFAELLALHGVLASCMEAVLGCAHGAPGDAEAGLVKARERSLEAFNIEHVLLGNLHIVHHNHAGG